MPEKTLDHVIEEARNAKCEYIGAQSRVIAAQAELKEASKIMERSGETYAHAIHQIHEMTSNPGGWKPDYVVKVSIEKPLEVPVKKTLTDKDICSECGLMPHACACKRDFHGVSW